MNQQVHDEAAVKVERPVRRAVYALGGLFVLALAVLFVMNALVLGRIRRINERGGLVKSWSSNILEPFVRPFGYKAVGWVEDTYVIRQRYEVYFGDLDVAVGCGTGLTLWLRSEGSIDGGDSGLEAAKELHGIGLLSLVNASVTDAGLEHLRGMRGLEYLDLGWTLVQGPGLVHLQGLPLQTLSLHGIPINDAGLEYLPDLPLLRYLDLGNTCVTGRGLAHLHQYPKLTSLDLSGTPITDDLVQELIKLPIEELNLYDTQITDAALAYLEKMPQLRSVHLCRTEVTAEAAAHSSSRAIRGWLATRDALCRHIGHEAERYRRTHQICF